MESLIECPSEVSSCYFFSPALCWALRRDLCPGCAPRSGSDGREPFLMGRVWEEILSAGGRQMGRLFPLPTFRQLVSCCGFLESQQLSNSALGLWLAGQQPGWLPCTLVGQQSSITAGPRAPSAAVRSLCSLPGPFMGFCVAASGCSRPSCNSDVLLAGWCQEMPPVGPSWHWGQTLPVGWWVLKTNWETTFLYNACNARVEPLTSRPSVQPKPQHDPGGSGLPLLIADDDDACLCIPIPWSSEPD